MAVEKVFLISNLRGLLIGFLLFEFNLKNTLFIMDSKTLYGLNKKEIEALNIIVVSKPSNILSLFFCAMFFYIKCYFFLLKNFNKNLTVYGADHILGAKFFLRRFPFFLIEDGTANYDLKSYQRSWKNKLFSIPVFGVHKNVKKIYLTQNENIPDVIKDKVEVINVKQLWDDKTDKEKSLILKFFDMENANFSILKERKNILFTQPLSEDGILTEREKIELYEKIVKKYDAESLIIKPHPREKTDYTKYFENVYVLRDNYPSELLELLGLKFNKAITLFSTAVLQYEKNKIDFYGVECHPKLKERFGSIDFYAVNASIS